MNTRQAYSEIDEFLSLLTDEQINKIPLKLRELFKDEKDKEYIKGINKNIPIKEQSFKKETLAIIALLNLQYWCEEENEKERLRLVYAENEKIYQEALQVKFNPDNMFKKKMNAEVCNNENNKKQEMVIYKESVFKKIINKILKIFQRDN